MITKTKKSEIIKDLSDKLSRKKIAIFSDFHGVSVVKLQSLRRLFKKTGGEYKVAKKTRHSKFLEEFWEIACLRIKKLWPWPNFRRAKYCLASWLEYYNPLCGV